MHFVLDVVEGVTYAIATAAVVGGATVVIDNILQGNETTGNNKQNMNIVGLIEYACVNMCV